MCFIDREIRFHYIYLLILEGSFNPPLLLPLLPLLVEDTVISWQSLKAPQISTSSSGVKESESTMETTWLSKEKAASISWTETSPCLRWNRMSRPAVLCWDTAARPAPARGSGVSVGSRKPSSSNCFLHLDMQAHPKSNTHSLSTKTSLLVEPKTSRQRCILSEFRAGCRVNGPSVRKAATPDGPEEPWNVKTMADSIQTTVTESSDPETSGPAQTCCAQCGKQGLGRHAPRCAAAGNVVAPSTASITPGRLSRRRNVIL